jgi:hypothetical protein
MPTITGTPIAVPAVGDARSLAAYAGTGVTRSTPADLLVSEPPS